MKVKALLRLVQTKVSPDTSIEIVWQLLAKRNITLLSVVNSDGKLVGVVGEDDLLYKLVPDYREYFSEFFPAAPNMKDVEEMFEREITLTAKDVMNKKVISIGADQEIFRGLSKMMAYKVRVLPVVDDDNKFLGMLVEDDIMAYLFKRHKNLLKAVKKKRS